MSDALDVDLEELTIAEIERVEELSGAPIDALGDPKRAKGRLLRAIVCVIKQRDDPSFSWEAAGDFKVNMLNLDRPTAANGSAS